MVTIVMVITIDASTTIVNGWNSYFLFRQFRLIQRLPRCHIFCASCFYETVFTADDEDVIRYLIEIFYFFLDNNQPVFTSFFT